MFKVKIATAPCSWGVWHADGSPSMTSWETFLNEAVEAGYEALELGPFGFLPTERKKLQEELRLRNMTVCAGTLAVALDRLHSFNDIADKLDTVCSHLSENHIGKLVIMDGSDVGENGEKKRALCKDDWKRKFQLIKTIGYFADDLYGILPVFHPHIGSLIETEAEIDLLLNRCSIKLCLDTGHHAYANSATTEKDTSVVDFIAGHADSIEYLHFKNVNPDVLSVVRREGIPPRKAFSMGVMCELDKGIVDFPKVREILERIGFDGIGVVETDIPNPMPGEAFRIAKRNLDYLKSIGF